ncbi:MAG: hypothetical protein QM831_44135 [Kofleriaceae bacterium]
MPTYAQLVGILGKPVDDPAVAKVIGKAKVSKDAIISVDDGYEFNVDRPTGASNRAPKVLTYLILKAPGYEKSKGFKGLPKPFAFGLDRAALIELHPVKAWALGENVEPDDPEAFRFYWDLDGYEFSAELSLKSGELKSYGVEAPEEAVGGRDLSTYPLHFEAAPADEPEHADITGMALLLAWATETFEAPAKHKALTRKVSPRAHFLATCKDTLTSLDVDKKLGDFLWGYTNRMFNDADTRDGAARTIKKWLKLKREDEVAYPDDYLATFSDLKNPFYVPGTWEAVDRIAPVLNARWADYQKTKFKKPPDLKLYEQAAKARDAVKVSPDKAGAKPVIGEVDTASLLAMIGMPLTDKTTKETIIRAGMPVGKKIDQQANPALGVAYMGDKEKGKMRCSDVYFFAAKQKSYIRGIGKEVIFGAYKGELPLGIKFGDKRAAVHKVYGKPIFTNGDAHDGYTDGWYPRKDRRIALSFSRNGNLVSMTIGLPADWADPPHGPWGPKGIF